MTFLLHTIYLELVNIFVNKFITEFLIRSVYKVINKDWSNIVKQIILCYWFSVYIHDFVCSYFSETFFQKMAGITKLRILKIRHNFFLLRNRKYGLILNSVKELYFQILRHGCNSWIFWKRKIQKSFTKGEKKLMYVDENHLHIAIFGKI